MKVMCLRYPRNTVTDILICLLCIFVISLILINAEYRKEMRCDVKYDVISGFLEENGWIADISSGSVSEKTIPYFFDETYEEYSLLQKSQGFDIEDYKGKKVEVDSFPLLNFPGYEHMENIYINLIIYNGEIIGADIHCNSINGFITGAVRNVNTEN